MVVVIIVLGVTAGAQGAELPVVFVVCGQSVTTSIQVANNLDGCVGSGLVVAADGITIDLGGHHISGSDTLSGINNSTGHDRVTIRDGAVSGFATGVAMIGADDGVVKDLVLTNNDAYGVNVSLAVNNVIEGNSITGNDVAGISLLSSHSNTIENNIVANNISAGISLSSSNENVVKKNDVFGNVNADGISLFASSLNTVKKNTVTANTFRGIALNATSGTDVRGNTVTGHESNGIDLFSASDDSVKDNEVSANDGEGIYISFGGGLTVKKDKTNENGLNGIRTDTSSVTITSNTAKRNGFLNSATGDDIGLGISAPTGTAGNDNPLECVPSALC